jgi:hypothetical protein
MRDLKVLLLLLLLLFYGIDKYECLWNHDHYLFRNPSIIKSNKLYRFEADSHNNYNKYIDIVVRCQHTIKCSSSPEIISLSSSSLSEAAAGTSSSSSSDSNQRLQHHHFIRPLGGYERLLSRTCPDSKAVALSHAAGYIINTVIDSSLLHSAMVYVVER